MDIGSLSATACYNSVSKARHSVPLMRHAFLAPPCLALRPISSRKLPILCCNLISRDKASASALRISRRAAVQAASLLLIGSAVRPFLVQADTIDENGTNSSSNADDLEKIDPAVNEPPFTSSVYLDLSVAGARPRRITIGCYGSIVPKTVANFEELARRPTGQAGYADTKVYRLLPGLTVQMGDVLHNNGRSGAAARGGTIPAEGYRIKHTRPGIVSMVRGPSGAVDSRFFITTRPGDSGYLDVEGREYVAFGRVTDGLDVLTDLDRVGSRTGDSRPNASVVIVGCGTLQ